MEDPVTKAERELSEGDPKSALMTATQALLSASKNSDLPIIRARALSQLKRHEEAARQWSHVQRTSPDAYNGMARLRHAAALIELGHITEADALVKAVDPGIQDGGLRGRLIPRILRGCEGVAERTSSASEIVGSNATLSETYRALMQNNAEAADALTYQSVIVVTYGRTGSTLLQGILNTIDGITILGENNGAFFDLFEFHEKMRQRSGPKIPDDLPSSPFFGNSSLDAEAMRESLRGVVANYFAPFTEEEGVRCIGFKELQFKDNPDRMVEYLVFLESIFPNPAFLFLWRDHEAVLRSGFWKSKDQVRAGRILAQIEEHAARFAEGRKNCFTLDYVDLSADAPRLEEMVQFLGGQFNPDRIAQVIEIPHSYAPESAEIKKKFADARTDL